MTAPVTHNNKSILAQLKDGLIDVPTAIEKAEVYLGQGLALVPGGNALVKLFEDGADVGQATVKAPLTALAAVIEAPVDTFLAASVPGAGGQVLEADFNASVEQAEQQLNAWVALKVAEFKANLSAGAAKAS